MEDELSKAALKELHFLQGHITSIKNRYDQEDVRLSIFDGFHTILRVFLTVRSVIAKHNNTLLDVNRAVYRKPNLQPSDLKIQISNLQRSSIAQLLVNSWSEFELFISFLTNDFFNEKKKNELMSKKAEDFTKKCRANGIDLEKHGLKDELAISNFHLVPSLRKALSLLKVLRSSFDDSEVFKYSEAREFIQNYSRLRNCMHSNYIFQGKNSLNYSYEGTTYTFTPGKPVNMDPSTDQSLFDLFIGLRKISVLIVDNVDYDGEIKDPTYLLD